ncbi:uncharacterized protein LOC116023539 [Ipomoea triloba]|uniref:uncharacterized protein LOC116023539 n=1 Tax=Ipomoea triloba TaxID=35885 RepID=UPI00125E0844|nr:uncharacterized protein LOC116023539 [Ipomoea triloba]
MIFISHVLLCCLHGFHLFFNIDSLALLVRVEDLNRSGSSGRLTSASNTGWVLRDEDGRFLDAKNVHMTGSFDVEEAEAFSMREALSWLKDTGMGSVDVETDSQLLFNALSCNSFYFAFGLIVDDIKELTSLIDDVKFGFVRRYANCGVNSICGPRFICDNPFLVLFY